MKKLSILFLASCLLFSLSACESSDSTSNGDIDHTHPIGTTETVFAGQSTGTTASVTDSSNNESTTSIPDDQTTTSIPTPTDSKPTATNIDTQTSAPVHTHSFSKATCTAPEKCSCGEIRGGALGHSWKKATCTTPKTCSRCGKTNGKSLGHAFSETGWSITCSRCGEPDPALTKPDSIYDLFDDIVNERLYVTETTYVYLGPDTEYEIIGTLKKGDIVTRTSRGRLVGWNQIEYNGKRAYVDSSCLSTKDPFYIVADAHGFHVGDTISATDGDGQDFTLTYLGEDRWEDQNGHIWTSYEHEDGSIHWSSIFG